MKINLENLDEAVWVEWKNGVKVKIRPLPTSKTVELQKLATSTTFEFINGRRTTVKKVDDEKFNDLLQEHIIEDWKGFKDQDGNDIPCTPKTKTAIMDYLHEFRLFVVMAGNELEQYRQEQQEEAEKNS